jgi:hypothetical protein
MKQTTTNRTGNNNKKNDFLVFISPLLRKRNPPIKPSNHAIATR